MNAIRLLSGLTLLFALSEFTTGQIIQTPPKKSEMQPGKETQSALATPVRTKKSESDLLRKQITFSGFMVDVSPQDYGGSGPLAGIAFQRQWEQRAFAAGGGDYRAPVQTIGDFLSGHATKSLGSVPSSYQPGVTPADLRECLPLYVVATLQEAIPAIERTLRGFANPDAVLVGVETRSSSPLAM